MCAMCAMYNVPGVMGGWQHCLEYIAKSSEKVLARGRPPFVAMSILGTFGSPTPP